MNYTITINASTPEELSSIVNRLNGVGIVQTPVTQAPTIQAPAIQDQPNYQQQQAITPTVSPQAMQPGFTPDPSLQYQQPVQQYSPGQQGQMQQNYGQAPIQNQAPVQHPQLGQVPIASAPTYTMEQLGVAAGPFVDAGRGQELLAWINQRGASALSQLDKAHYGDFATYLRSLGAKI